MRVVIAVLILLVPATASAQRVASANVLQPLPKQGSSTALADAARREAARLSARLSQTAATQHTAPNRSWPARHPVLTGTLAGAGVGLGMLASQGCGSSDYTCPGLAAFFAGTGAGLGALGGVVADIFIR